MNPKKGSCYSRPKRGRGIRALKTGEGDDKVINTQESHLAALLGSRDMNSWLSVLCVGMGEREEGSKAPSQMPWSESCKCKGRAGPQHASPHSCQCRQGIFGAQAMKIWTVVLPIHLLRKHLFPFSTEA